MTETKTLAPKLNFTRTVTDSGLVSYEASQGLRDYVLTRKPGGDGWVARVTLASGHALWLNGYGDITEKPSRAWVSNGVEGAMQLAQRHADLSCR